MRLRLFLFVFACVAISSSVTAQCISPLQDADFESQRDRRVRSPWISEGAAGVDIGLTLSQRGANNAFMRATKGWNGIRQRLTLNAAFTYTLTAYVRTSNNVKDGYFGFRNASQKVLQEVKFGPINGYTRLQVRFRPAKSGLYNVFVGFWAPDQDAWVQVDNFSINFPCNDAVATPADE